MNPMTKKFAAAVFALLALTAPVHAATIEAIDLNFANGFKVTGDITFTDFGPAGVIPTSGIPTLCCALDGTAFFFVSFVSPPSPVIYPFTYISPAPFVPGFHIVESLYFTSPFGTIPQSFQDFVLVDGFGNSFLTVSGDVSIVSPVPLPSALPLFGSALLDG